jgi:hypothetical protein
MDKRKKKYKTKENQIKITKRKATKNYKTENKEKITKHFKTKKIYLLSRFFYIRLWVKMKNDYGCRFSV